MAKWTECPLTKEYVRTQGSLQIALYGGWADLVLSRAAGKVLDLRTALDRRSRADDERAALLNTQEPPTRDWRSRFTALVAAVT